MSCRLTESGKMVLDIAHLIDRKYVERYQNKFASTSAMHARVPDAGLRPLAAVSLRPPAHARAAHRARRSLHVRPCSGTQCPRRPSASRMRSRPWPKRANQSKVSKKPRPRPGLFFRFGVSISTRDTTHCASRDSPSGRSSRRRAAQTPCAGPLTRGQSASRSRQNSRSPRCSTSTVK